MSESEIEAAAAEVAEFREVVESRDSIGWESEEDEQWNLNILIDAKKKLAKLQGDKQPDAELSELQERLAELEAEIAEQTGKGEQWAETVEITIRPIDANIIDVAASYFGDAQGYRGVVTYCRHKLTNYDQLLTIADRFPGRPRDILSMRVIAAIEEALQRIGIEENSFLDPLD